MQTLGFGRLYRRITKCLRLCEEKATHSIKRCFSKYSIHNQSGTVTAAHYTQLLRWKPGVHALKTLASMLTYTFWRLRPIVWTSISVSCESPCSLFLPFKSRVANSLWNVLTFCVNTLEKPRTLAKAEKIHHHGNKPPQLLYDISMTCIIFETLLKNVNQKSYKKKKLK